LQKTKSQAYYLFGQGESLEINQTLYNRNYRD
jgi:hypothetical protein